MNRSKCVQCGLVNAAWDKSCRRCGAELTIDEAATADEVSTTPRPIGQAGKRRSAFRISWILGTTLLLLFSAYMSLLLSSTELPYEQRQIVNASIAILERQGFNRQAFVLKHVVQFRITDNWWNGYVGHQSAYAATNFPFEVITLYPEFFETAIDDTERAAILLHESHHLFGAGEAAALEGTWRKKGQLGWTEDKYGRTKVWVNTRELTVLAVPGLFTCGADGHTDCIP
jgi:hypothetical protein